MRMSLSSGARAPESGDGEREPATDSLWRNFDYVGWWTGNTVSALGTSVSAIAYPPAGRTLPIHICISGQDLGVTRAVSEFNQSTSG
jgi:hypothetical protein